jgi:hypothetical protein
VCQLATHEEPAAVAACRKGGAQGESGDQPITDLVRDDVTGTLYAATDFGVLGLTAASTDWRATANGLPPVAVYGLTISSANRVLYAATHGRGAWS